MMTHEEVILKLSWRDSNEARLACFLSLLEFNAEIRILAVTEHQISDRSVRTINDFLELSSAQLEAIKNFLWENCKFCCEVTSYGFDVPDGKNEAQANHNEFRVHGSEDVLKQSTLKYLLVIEDDQESYRSNFGYLIFDSEWNSSLTAVVMKNGDIVGCGDSGLYVGAFE
jgi:hypothetical protein